MNYCNMADSVPSPVYAWPLLDDSMGFCLMTVARHRLHHRHCCWSGGVCLGFEAGGQLRGFDRYEVHTGFETVPSCVAWQLEGAAFSYLVRLYEVEAGSPLWLPRWR